MRKLIADILGTFPTWSTLVGKPATFPPSAHTHPSAEISDASATGGEGVAVLRGDEGQLVAGLSGIGISRTALYPDFNKLVQYTNAFGGSITLKCIFASVPATREYTFPDRDGTVALLQGANVFTGENTFTTSVTNFEGYALFKSSVAFEGTIGLEPVSATSLRQALGSTIPGSYANDAAAASASVPVGSLYHTAGAVKVRLT